MNGNFQLTAEETYALYQQEEIIRRLREQNQAGIRYLKLLINYAMANELDLDKPAISSSGVSFLTRASGPYPYLEQIGTAGKAYFDSLFHFPGNPVECLEEFEETTGLPRELAVHIVGEPFQRGTRIDYRPDRCSLMGIRLEHLVQQRVVGFVGEPEQRPRERGYFVITGTPIKINI